MWRDEFGTLLSEHAFAQVGRCWDEPDINQRANLPSRWIGQIDQLSPSHGISRGFENYFLSDSMGREVDVSHPSVTRYPFNPKQVKRTGLRRNSTEEIKRPRKSKTYVV
jgi:hypothetical protein